MAEDRWAAGAPVRPSAVAPSRGAHARTETRPEGTSHFLPGDGRRFPLCGSWRSNWNHTGELDRVTCPECLARVAEQPPAG
jgi:hypothetical protein